MGNRTFKTLLISLISASQIVPAQCYATDPPPKIARLLPWTTRDHGKAPDTAADNCVEELAKNIDWLENRLNLYGTVIAKSPDVWGEARLTAHRQEFEELLKQELREFDKNQLNGAEYVNDQAFIAFALAMKNTATGTTPATAATGAEVSASVARVENNGNVTSTIKTDFTGPGSLFGLAQKEKLAIGSDIRVEQTEMLDQLARYINHLHAIRRINEGDDTSDSPGYAMNLVRVPVSVLPGHHTKQGFGAEITITATPYIGPELLPVAFRDFVVNDLVDQLAVPIARYINAEPQKVDQLMTTYQTYQQTPLLLEKWNQEMLRTGLPPGIGWEVSEESFAKAINGFPGGEFFLSNGQWSGACVTTENMKKFKFELRQLLDAATSNSEKTIDRGNGQDDNGSSDDNKGQQKAKVFQLRNNILQSKSRPSLAEIEGQLEKIYEKPAPPPNSAQDFKTLSQDIFFEGNLTKNFKEIEAAISSLDEIQSAVDELSQAVAYLPAGTTRRSTLPFPPTQLLCNYGMEDLANFTSSLYQALRADIVNREVVHVTDIQAYLREELAAAYELMNQPQMFHWWEEAANGQSTLVQDIRLRRTDAIAETRLRFTRELQTNCSVTQCSIDQSAATMAWCVYVESLLLNERLVQDIRETMGNKPNGFGNTQWFPYFGPNPPQEARMNFNEYVRIRWPIRVFALDPQVNEQNIADVRSIYRQMQMSIALAFASGQTNLSAALQAMRKLQRDRATVDLNRTAIGFGHGDDTFGWKFYPRFQTPPVEGNATVLFRDLIAGGPTDKHLESSRQIEPGMRECTAIVLMPSFVPHVTFTTRSHWFKLGKEGVTADSIEDTMTYSRAIKQMQVQAQQSIQCAHLYRDGEVDRLLSRIHQLDRKLPLQTLECTVPIENSLGGFEIFSTGTRELAPELNGWYGSPGYDQARGGQMFFAGDNFSVPNSRLLVGNQEIPMRLLSRQIIEVNLPPGLAITRDRKLDEFASEQYTGYLDAHIATPYGVSGHMLIPVLRKSDAAVSVSQLSSTTFRIRAVRNKDANGPIKTIEKLEFFQSPPPFVLTVPQNVGLESDPIKVGISTTCGNDRLADVGFPSGIDLIASNSPNSYVMDLNVLNDQLGSTDKSKIKTHLGAAIKDHLEFILQHNNNTPVTVNYKTTLTILVSSKRVPVSGSIDIIVDIQ